MAETLRTPVRDLLLTRRGLAFPPIGDGRLPEHSLRACELVVLSAVPVGGVGVILMLFITGTALNVQSLLGVIFMIGMPFVAVCSGELL